MRHLLLFLLIAFPAAAQEIPACTQDRAGAVACMAGKLCACGYQRGGSVSGRPDGWRWDCGILRPACGEALPPPSMPGTMQPLPQLLLPLDPPPFTPPFTPWPR
ncbi:MAG: hypothetical protein RLZZ187_3013 [Pseudomonadota bacterium]|jgi:hypothetical protein